MASWPILPRLIRGAGACPLCTSIRFREAEAGSLDRVMRIFGMVPVRCDNCWRRYYRFEEKQ